MDRKLLYVFSLIVYFVMWVVFGFAAGGPRGEPALQARLAPTERAEMNAEVLGPAIPVTGQPPSTGMIALSLLLASGILITFLAFRNAANKPTAYDVRRKDPPNQS